MTVKLQRPRLQPHPEQTRMSESKCLNVKTTRFYDLDFELGLTFELCHWPLPAQGDCHALASPGSH